MTINEFFRKHGNGKEYQLFPRITCTDGFSLSVQAGEGKYSAPRHMSKHFSQVEVGFPSAKEDDLMEWAETPDAPTETVYGYVPVETVDAVIAKHGGMIEA